MNVYFINLRLRKDGCCSFCLSIFTGCPGAGHAAVPAADLEPFPGSGEGEWYRNIGDCPTAWQRFKSSGIPLVCLDLYTELLLVRKRSPWWFVEGSVLLETASVCLLACTNSWAQAWTHGLGHSFCLSLLSSRDVVIVPWAWCCMTILPELRKLMQEDC